MLTSSLGTYYYGDIKFNLTPNLVYHISIWRQQSE